MIYWLNNRQQYRLEHAKAILAVRKYINHITGSSNDSIDYLYDVLIIKNNISTVSRHRLRIMVMLEANRQNMIYDFNPETNTLHITRF